MLTFNHAFRIFFFILLFGFQSCLQAYIDSASAEFQKSIEEVADQQIQLPQTDIPESKWYLTTQQWGPPAKQHSAPKIPANVNPKDYKIWKQRYVITIALKYKGLHYSGKKNNDPFKTSKWKDIPDKASNGEKMRGHFPGRGYGLDCSNFVAWVYNLTGIYFTSDCAALVDYPKSNQSKGIGRILSDEEELQPGDLIFLKGDKDSGLPPHVIIYCGIGEQIGKKGDRQHYCIDSTSSAVEGVAPRLLKPSSWRYPSIDNPRFARVTRPLDAQ
jgi:cell wall-associated NlpC family hydrolase